MKTSFIFREYLWIIETLRREGKVSLKQLSERWQTHGFGGGQPLSRSSFTRYREAILEIFGIDITCTRGTGFEYYIRNIDQLEGNTAQSWMVSALSIGNIVSDRLPLQDRVVLERIPAHSEYLNTVFEAMSSCMSLNIRYRKYGSDADHHYEIEPYCLKLFRQRWYVLGKYSVLDPDLLFAKPEERLHLFCFDRIKEMSISDRFFIYDTAFNAETFFKHAFGVYIDPTMEPERILLRAYGMKKCYLDEVPIHESQQKIEEGTGYADYEVVLRPTPDFFHELLAHGNRLKVLEPSWVADEMHHLIRGMLRLYES